MVLVVAGVVCGLAVAGVLAWVAAGRALWLIAAGSALCFSIGAGAAWALARGTARPSAAGGASAAHMGERLRATEMRYWTYWNHTAEALFVVRVTADGRFIFEGVNPEHERRTGLRSAMLEGKEPHECLPPAVAAAVTENYRRCVLAGGPIRYEETVDLPTRREPGRCETTLAPVRDPETGRIVLLIGIARDIAERRRMEDALRQSQKMEAVGRLTGGIAHDFNNMLTVIAGNLERLEHKLSYEPGLLHLVSSAALAASRAEMITQQLLTFSRRQQLRPQPIDFNKIIIGMDELLRHTVGESIEIRRRLAPELWLALADHNQMETALLNLILNARDAIKGSGQITIETANAEFDAPHLEPPPGAYATLSVTDTGHGISAEVLAHVFEPFFTTKEVGKGTGLGLSQIYGFLKQSAGHIKIESRPGNGTTVRVYLPRADLVGAIDEPPTADAGSPE